MANRNQGGDPGGGGPAVREGPPPRPRRRQARRHEVEEDPWQGENYNRKQTEKANTNRVSKGATALEQRNAELEDHYSELQRLRNVVKGAKDAGDKKVIAQTTAKYNALLEKVKATRQEIKEAKGTPIKIPSKLAKGL